MGIAFFQFGVGIAESRSSPWTTFERILPAPIAVRLSGHVVPAALFAAAAAGLVIVVAHVFMPVALSAVAWLRLCLVLLAGSVPLSLLGVAIGYWVSSRAALPVANIACLGLAFAGGVFISPQFFPGALDAISQCLVSRHIVELAWAAVADAPWSPARLCLVLLAHRRARPCRSPTSGAGGVFISPRRGRHRNAVSRHAPWTRRESPSWLWISGYTAAAFALAVWGYRRDEGERYR